MAKRTPQIRVGGRAVFYHRDSTGRHDQTPGQYVEWAVRDCATQKLTFDGSREAMNSLLRTGGVVAGDIYLDFDVQGHLLSRPALDAMLQRISQDMSIS